MSSTRRKEVDDFIRRFDEEVSKSGLTRNEIILNIYGDLLNRIADLEEKLGVLVNEPSQEQLNRHKTLKRAYKQYKFVEKLVLGEENESIHR